MRRRQFVKLAGSALALPSVVPIAWAQKAQPMIGVLAHATEEGFRPNAQWFSEGLAKGGIQIGRDATLTFAYTLGHIDRIPALATDLIARKVVLIATTGDTPTQVVRKLTSTIPVVFSIGTDPVAQGLVSSLNRPGGNLTGVTTLNYELGQKRIEVLHELLPKGAQIALLHNPASAFAAGALRDIQSAIQRFGREILIFEARTLPEIEAVFPAIQARRPGGLVINADAFFNNNASRLATLALEFRLPAIYATRGFASAGGLVSYGTDLKDLFRIQGLYAARVLKGERPADLPVQQAAKIEMVVNLKTAATLGVIVPQHLLARADEVIE